MSEALMKTGHGALETWVKSQLPPTDIISAEDWSAMDEHERAAAYAMIKGELNRSMEEITPDFPRVKIPTGGGLYWVMPDGSQARDLEGILIGHFRARAYWPIEQEVSNEPPVCSSTDGLRPASGQGPTGAKTCSVCPFDSWGTGKQGRGKACKERLNVFFLTADSELPWLLSLPPTSLKPYSRYVVALQTMKPVRPTIGVTTKLGLKVVNGPLKYSVVDPQVGETLPFKVFQTAIAFRDQFEAAMKKRGAEVDMDAGEHDIIDAEGNEKAY